MAGGDHIHRERGSQEPLPQENLAQGRLGMIQDSEQRKAFLRLVGVDGRVVLVFEDLKRKERVCVDLHGVE